MVICRIMRMTITLRVFYPHPPSNKKSSPVSTPTPSCSPLTWVSSKSHPFTIHNPTNPLLMKINLPLQLSKARPSWSSVNPLFYIWKRKFWKSICWKREWDKCWKCFLWGWGKGLREGKDNSRLRKRSFRLSRILCWGIRRLSCWISWRRICYLISYNRKCHTFVTLLLEKYPKQLILLKTTTKTNLKNSKINQIHWCSNTSSTYLCVEWNSISWDKTRKNYKSRYITIQYLAGTSWREPLTIGRLLLS